MKRIITSILAIAVATALTACGGSTGSSTAASSTAPAAGGESTAASSTAPTTDTVLNLKLAENQSAGNPISDGVQKFADLVKEKTGGTVNIEVYLDAQLGNENETIDQVQAGTLDFARINTSALASTADSVSVFTLPYIFTSTEQKYKVLDGEIGQSVIKGLEQYNMIGLEYWEAGSRCFYTVKKPVNSVADLKGLKLRVQQSEVAIKMVELLGGAATPMAYGEVYQGLQTGVIDGAENDFVSYYSSGHYEVAKFYALDGHMAPPAMLIMGKGVWDKMSESQQTAVKEAAKEASLLQRTAMQAFQDEAKAKVIAAGCTVTEVNVKEFQDAVAGIYDLYPQHKATIEAIRATA